MNELEKITKEAEEELIKFERNDALKDASKFGLSDTSAKICYHLTNEGRDLAIGTGYTVGPVLKYLGLTGLTVSIVDYGLKSILTTPSPVYIKDFFLVFASGCILQGIGKYAYRSKENKKLKMLLIKNKNRLENCEREINELKKNLKE